MPQHKAAIRACLAALTEAEEKAKAFDAMAENGWWIDGNLEFEGEYVCLKSPNDIVGRSKTSKLAAVQDAMSKDGGK